MYNHPFLDFDQLNEKMIKENVPSYKKLQYIYKTMDGTFHDEEQRLLTGSRAALVGIGGFPISVINGKPHILNNEVDLNEVKQSLHTMMGFSAGMSYLNPYNKSNYSLAEKTLSLGHNSIKHTLYLNILLVGISIGVEHEYSSQRDLVHLSRLTVAKTSAQKDPCLVLHNPLYVEQYKTILSAHDQLSEVIEEKKDWESANLLFPSAKASMILLSGTLRNFEKIVELRHSGGKENEFISSLNQISDLIQNII